LPWDIQAPAVFRILVNGTALEDDIKRKIMSVTWRDASVGADSIEITMRDPSLKTVDQRVFAEGNEVDLFLGYGNRLQFVGRGQVWEPPSVSASERAQPQVTVTALGAARRMMEASKKKKGRSFGKSALELNIVERIAGDYSFAVQGEQPGNDRKTFKRSGMSDWEYLQKMAFYAGYRLWVEWIPSKSGGRWTVVFKPPGRGPTRPRNARASNYRFVWGLDYAEIANRLLSWDVTYSAEAGASSIEVLRFDRKTHNYAVLVANLEQAGIKWSFHGPSGMELIQEEIKTGSRVVFTAFGKQIHVVRDKPFKSDKEALEYAKSWLRKRALSFILLRGTVPGLPDLKKYTTHKLEGLPSRLAGDYEILDIETTWAAGGTMRTTFSAQRAEDVGLDMADFRA